MEEVDKEISEMKLSLNSRARIVAESYLVAVRLFLLYMHFDSPFFVRSSIIDLWSLHFMPCITRVDLSSIALSHLAWLIRLGLRGNT